MKNSFGLLKTEWIGKDKFLIPTPALVLDVKALEENIHFMATLSIGNKINLRPHCKGHKCMKIAQLQMEAGAIGISCATLGEAAVMVSGNIPGILITSPIVTKSKIEGLVALNQKAHDLKVVVDNLDNVKDLSRANASKKPLQVLVDFDIGQNRTGTKSIEEAINLAKEIERSPLLKLVGIQAYGGHMQHIANYEERRSVVKAQNERIKELCPLIQKYCSEQMIVSGGGTGTFDIDLSEKVYTEIQPGSYLFMDVQYSEVSLLKDRPSPFKPSLFVFSSVVSSYPSFAIVDAGLKAFATDGPKPQILNGFPNLSYSFMGDEHGKVTFLEQERNLPLGKVLEFLTPHCDPTVNLYDYYYCLKEDMVVDVWPVDARGLH